MTTHGRCQAKFKGIAEETKKTCAASHALRNELISFESD
jgi:organic hydroperoxide reductase OsmC/OhrA